MSKPYTLADLLALYDQLKRIEELAEAGAAIPAAEARQILAMVTTWRPAEITGRDGKEQTVLRSPGEWRGEVFRFSSPFDSGDIPPGSIRPLTLSRRAYLACVKWDAAAELEATAADAKLTADAVPAEPKVRQLGIRRPGAEATLHRLAIGICIGAGKVPYKLPSMLAAAYKKETGDAIHTKDPLMQKVVNQFKTPDWKPPAQTGAKSRPTTYRTVV